MTYTPNQCIRNCQRPCRCSDCAANDQPEHGPVPAMADKGYLCQRCWSRLWSWLTEIVDLYATLPLVREASGEQDESAHRKVSGSPALIALDAAALKDPGTNRYGYTGPDGFVEQDGPMFVPREVVTWGQVLADDLGLVMDVDRPPSILIHPRRPWPKMIVPRVIYTMTEAVELLTTFFDRVCESPWVDELWSDMKLIRSALGNAHGEKRPRMVGKCLVVSEVDGEMVACDRALYLPQGGASLKCGRCGRVYRGMDLVKVELQGELEKAG